jgi:hypothetical protein
MKDIGRCKIRRAAEGDGVVCKAVGRLNQAHTRYRIGANASSTPWPTNNSVHAACTPTQHITRPNAKLVGSRMATNTVTAITTGSGQVRRRVSPTARANCQQHSENESQQSNKKRMMTACVWRSRANESEMMHVPLSRSTQVPTGQEGCRWGAAAGQVSQPSMWRCVCTANSLSSGTTLFKFLAQTS